MGTPTRARGYPPMHGDHSLIVEVAPGLAIERVIDHELTPALFAAVAANEAERAAPDVTLVDVSMIGAAGRIYMSGPRESMLTAQDEITRVLSSIEGREH